MPTFDTWPFGVLSPADLEWSPVGGVDSGGPSLSGLEQLDRTDGGPKWIARMVRIPLATREQILAFQAMQMNLENGTAPIILPRRPRDRSPGGLATPGALTPHSDETPFDDSGLYLTPDSSAATTESAALRGDTLTFTLDAPRPLIGGEDFSINHPTASWRMYRVRRILEQDGTTYTVRIGPTLREDIPAAIALDFSDPRCVMRLSDPRAFATALQFNRYGWVDADFEEAFF